MSKVVGIDLGTTYSAIAHLDETGIAKIIPNKENKNITPSVVYIKDSQIIVGEEAQNFTVLEPMNTIECIKRNMGQQGYKVFADSQEYTPVEISSFILKKIKQDAEMYLNTSLKDAVITVPAYFGDQERQDTKKAGEMAGFNVINLLNEPTAAALFYCCNGNAKNKNMRILVYDLGGGTFDVSVIEMQGNDIKVLGTDGDHALGGKNFNDVLYSYFQKQLLEQFQFHVDNDILYSQELFEKVEKIKKSLTNKETEKLHISNYQLEITRNQFGVMTETLLMLTKAKMDKVMSDTKLEYKDLDKIVLVGGSSRMPMVRKMLTIATGKIPDISMNPDEVVALGAAIQASLIKKSIPVRTLPPVKLKDVCSRSLGIAVLRNNQEVNSVIIPQNSPYLDTRYTKEYKTTYEQQEILDIKVTEGEEENINLVKILHCYRFTGIPVREAGASRILVTFYHDANGILQIEAKDILSDKQLTQNSIALEKLEQEKKLAQFTRASKVLRLRVVLLIDVSGSMCGEPLKDAKEAAVKFLKKTMSETKIEEKVSLWPEEIDHESPLGKIYLAKIRKETGLDQNSLIQTIKPQSDIKIALVSFGSEANIECPFTEDQTKMEKAIYSLELSGSTDMSGGFQKAEILLEKESTPNKLAVVVTDGYPNNQEETEKIANHLKAKNVKIKTIYIGSGLEVDFLKRIASSDADSLQVQNSGQLLSVFGNLAQEIISNL